MSTTNAPFPSVGSAATCIMLVDAAIISSLLVVAHLLRARSRWLRQWLIPSSMIAGALGLALGPNALGLLPFSKLAGTGNEALAIGSWPGVLVVAVFGTLLLGHRQHKEPLFSQVRRVRPALAFNLAGEVGQFAMALLFGGLLLHTLAPSLPRELAVMLPAGFAGGAATSTVFAQGFEAQGWPDALSMGFAFAAIGQCIAIVAGMSLINLAVRRGWTSAHVANFAESSRSTEAFVAQDREPLGFETVNPLALDPLAWHLAIVGAVYGLAISVDAGIHQVLPGSYVVPQFALAMLLGAALQCAFDHAGWGVYVDRRTMHRIGSAAADILIICSIASIRPNVVAQYAIATAILALLGTAYSVAWLFMGRIALREYWFERSLFTFGWLTGVVGASVALVRVVDPRQKSAAVEEYGAAYLVIGPAEMLLYPIVIAACGAGHMTGLGAALALIAVGLIAWGRREGSRGFEGALPVLASDAALEAPSLP